MSKSSKESPIPRKRSVLLSTLLVLMFALSACSEKIEVPQLPAVDEVAVVQTDRPQGTSADATAVTGSGETQSTQVEDASRDDFRFVSLGGNELELTAYTGTATRIQVPAAVDGAQVVRIASEVFTRNVHAEEIYLPNTVREIGTDVFSYIPNLQVLEFSEGITVLPDSTLYDNPALEVLTLPPTLEVLQPYAISNCPLLAFIEIPFGITEVGSGNFTGLADGLVLEGTEDNPVKEYSELSENQFTYKVKG